MIVSIFNDVLGPVMRGQSSSHCAAALRIGRLARDLMGGAISEVLLEFDRGGSLATTHESQGSDMGFFGGLLGWEADDERLPGSAPAVRAAGIVVRFEIVDSHDPHPNAYRITLRNPHGEHRLRAISTGGGMIEVTEIDGYPVSIQGDYFETLIYLIGHGQAFVDALIERTEADEVLLHELPQGHLVEVKGQQFISPELLEELKRAHRFRFAKQLAPVLPVLSRAGAAVPFTNCEEMLEHDRGRNSPLWKLATEFEMARGNLSEAEVLERMLALVWLWRRSIAQGIAGTSYDDRILGHQSSLFQKCMEAKQLLAAGVLNRIVLYVTALMEVKSAMGVIVAAPTAGACAALPGACLAVADEIGASDEDAARALLSAGLIGAFIATRSTFAAEVAGCQAESGSAASMAAAALVTLANGTQKQAIAAASMALQNSLGLICDPVANRVEVPCLGKNVMAASNALSCANMALADFDPVIPLDEVIDAADRVGRSLPRELRCTALGGLAITKTSQQLERELAERKAAANARE